MLNAPYHSHNRKWNYIIPCFDISSNFLLALAVLTQPLGRQDCPGWGSPPKAAKLGKAWGSSSGEWGLHSSKGTQPPRCGAEGCLSSSGSAGTLFQHRGNDWLISLALLCTHCTTVLYSCKIQLLCKVVQCSYCVQLYSAAIVYFISRLCLIFLNAQCPV